MSNDQEVLLGLSSGELEALAEGVLAPSIQARLDDLVAQSKQQCMATIIFPVWRQFRIPGSRRLKNVG